jgi:hypothetical protein
MDQFEDGASDSLGLELFCPLISAAVVFELEEEEEASLAALI